MRRLESLRASANFDRVLACAARQLAAAADTPPAAHGPMADAGPEPAGAAPPSEGAAPPPPPMTSGLEGFAGAIVVTGDADPASAVDEAAQRIAEGAPPAPGREAVQYAVEAIVLDTMRPPWLIVGDAIRIDRDFDRADLVSGRLDLFNGLCRPVGRVDLIHHATNEFVGTGWPIAPGIVVTNRHVAQEFAEADASGRLRFRRGLDDQPIEATLNCIAQQETDGLRRRTFVNEVLFVAGPGEPDMAFLRIEPATGIEPLPISARPAAKGDPVGAIGYPARDSRNDATVMGQVFQDIYNVKRFSPGFVMEVQPHGATFTTDYSTLGGNSGSAIVSLDSGEVVGLHFAGAYHSANYGVPVDLVTAALRAVLPRTHPSAAVPGPDGAAPGPEAAPRDRVTAPEALAGREGYDPAFLGPDRRVELPDVGDWGDDLAPVAGRDDGQLTYRHFSVLQSASRRMPLLTAVNIDGAEAQPLKRRDRWALDGRIDAAHQIGGAFYADNPFDKGHMVRRRDPGWGTPEAAREGEEDSFHYTNAAPQHAALNQRHWAGLEDYLMGAAETRGFRLSVFTGPVLRESDRPLAGAAPPPDGGAPIRIPEEFWKVAVMINDATGALHATGYVLSQGRMIRDLTEAAFVLGAYRTYQLPIRQIEAATGLDFGAALREADPLDPGGRELAPRRAVPIDGPDDLVL